MMATTTLNPYGSLNNRSVVQRCRIFPNQPERCDIIIGVKRAVAALSLIGCVFMMVVIWLFRKYNIFTQRLIFYLSIGAMFDSIAYLMTSDVPDGPFCRFQAFFLTLFDWSVLLWVCCITFNLYMNAIRMMNTEKFEWAYHIVSWGVSLLMSCLPFIANNYGPAGAWCWIKDFGWRFGIWYGPLFCIIALLFVTYIYIIVKVQRKVKTYEGTYDPDIERGKQLLKEDVKPLRGYPFVYLAVSIFPLINRIQNATSDTPVFALVLLHAMSSPLQGFLNAVVFGLDKDTMRRLKPSELRAAWMNYRTARTPIHEYPEAASSSVDSSVASTDALTPTQSGTQFGEGTAINHRTP